MAPLPEIVLIHGAWHTPKNYTSYMTDLQKAGFTVHAPHLPSNNGIRPPTASLPEDISLVRNLVQDLVNTGTRILMVMHSYGGLVGTSAIQDLDLSTRQANNQPGGVIHLLYLCAYMLSPGETMWSIVEQTGADKLWPDLVDEHDDGTFFPLDPGILFFSGLEDSEFVEGVIETLVRFPIKTLKEMNTGDGWRRVPVTFVKTLRDFALQGAAQDIMLERVRGEGIFVKVVEFDTHHSPWVSMAGDVVRVAVEAAGDERNPK
ncbi:hypothetical protein PENANT_c015G02068 [Penicillium antarcticum]|uniref:AB hydrolase-1 domain-containing protein n=1 Tax=Penicillium antarcticum TaxID=416450 RepID=A0A1V6Q339_9EURO|nr:uncharacterized protein N7508_004848 [Penicillium antarcticum]KAJ5305833.1 hypothetical protein N7508_004848 [Penicillium antarcticum]OQD83679.1 hypothetical protein PENANT_c015G02068 [Penicillium antarcticum]